jgi:Ca2+-binding EF-hand superfamily protein
MMRVISLSILLMLAWTGPVLAGPGEGGLARLDSNHDGVISRAEAIAAEKRAFHHFDKNGDGYIGWPEFNASRPGQAEAKLSPAQKTQRQRTRKAWFHNFDSNGDGRISLSEYLAGTMPYFNRLDTNGDGVIEGRELEKALHTGRSPR